ncbi:hypothetical protein DH2020_007423 [Rehmannia glutinosa]|uniref:protein-disulfide reductase n=1 Tax=Rehmannia glutinosa TaxID=99300 RepID=A0ABR0TYI0_REHGL
MAVFSNDYSRKEEVKKIEGKVNGVDVEYGESQMFSGSRLVSLLSSKDRDFLLSPTGTQVKISDLEGKIVGIYFSANWYPPYQNAFDEYRALMPWLAIPFSDLESKRALNRRFDVEGIPCLIILQPNDNKDSTILDGVDLVYRYGIQAYPFTKERVEELTQQEKDTHENQTLKDLLTNHGRDFLLSNSVPKQVFQRPALMDEARK